MRYDYLIAGAGPFGAAFARAAADLGHKCLVIDKRAHVAGNAHTERVEGINVHSFGAHIFHTDNDAIWNFVQRFGQWLPFHHSPRVRAGNRVFSFPINLLTLQQLWGVSTPDEARRRLAEVRVPCEKPRNAEEWLLSQVGREIYELFFHGAAKRDRSDISKMGTIQRTIQRGRESLMLTEVWASDTLLPCHDVYE